MTTVRRWLLLAALSGLAATGSFLALSPVAGSNLWLAGLGLAVLAARWAHLYLSGRTWLVFDVFEIAAVLAVGIAVHPDRASAVLYAGLCYRSAFGSRAFVARGAAGYALMYVVAAAATREPDYTYSTVAALAQVPVFALDALLASQLVRLLDHLRAAARSARALQRLAVAYVGATDHRQLAERTAAAVEHVLGDRVSDVTVTIDAPAGAPKIAYQGVLKEADTSWLDAVAGQLELALGALDAQAQRQAHTASAQIRSLVENTGGVGLVVDRELMIAWSTPGTVDLLGEPADALVGRPVLGCFHRADADRAREVFDAVVAGDEVVGDRFTVRLRGSGEAARWVEVAVTDLLADASVGALVVQMRDVSARVAMEQDVRRRATHDPLTRLVNREHFEQLVEEALLAGPAGVAIGLIDIDDFRHVNETYGYAAGDEVLKDAARRLGFAAAGTGPVARIAGDGFAILLRESRDAGAARDVVQRLVGALDRPLDAGSSQVDVTASAGVARLGAEVRTVADLLVAADVALEHARTGGGDRVTLFSPMVHAERHERATLQRELAAAIDAGELELEYQPVVDQQTGDWSGAEALVRWRHPELGRLGPGRFIPLAEQSDLIVSVGRWVLGEACSTAARWRRDGIVDGTFTIAVNVSGVQLGRPDFPDTVADVLAATGLPADRLILEITETVVADLADARQVLGRLRDIGVRVAIDDFGTGHSSLAYLRELPADVLKIPRTFVVDIGRSESTAAVVRGVIGLARSLGLEPLAEGVELPEQREVLAEADCRLIQGFLYSRPLTPEAFAAQVVSGALA